MKYYAPVNMDQREICTVLSLNEEPGAVMAAALSAIYFHETKFSGDILLQALKLSPIDNKVAVAGLVYTFFQMHETDYNRNEYVDEMLNFAGENTSYAVEVHEWLEGVRELGAIFSNHQGAAKPSR